MINVAKLDSTNQAARASTVRIGKLVVNLDTRPDQAATRVPFLVHPSSRQRSCYHMR
jgi:hypothetical protein